MLRGGKGANENCRRESSVSADVALLSVACSLPSPLCGTFAQASFALICMNCFAVLAAPHKLQCCLLPGTEIGTVQKAVWEKARRRAASSTDLGLLAVPRRPGHIWTLDTRAVGGTPCFQARTA